LSAAGYCVSRHSEVTKSEQLSVCPLLVVNGKSFPLKHDRLFASERLAYYW